MIQKKTDFKWLLILLVLYIKKPQKTHVYKKYERKTEMQVTLLLLNFFNLRNWLWSLCNVHICHHKQKSPIVPNIMKDETLSFVRLVAPKDYGSQHRRTMDLSIERTFSDFCFCLFNIVWSRHGLISIALTVLLNYFDG